MKPTDQQVTAITTYIRGGYPGDDALTAAVIRHWESLRPPDPDLANLQRDLSRVTRERDKLIKEVLAKDQRIDTLTAELAALIDVPDPAPTVFPDPPHGWEWHNPENLTPAQVGIADGWRLCLAGETATAGCEQNNPHGWTYFGIARAPFGGGYVLTYRTRDPLPDPKPTAAEIERADFEAWVNNTKGEFDIELKYCGGGMYYHSHTRAAFAAWKAALNQTHTP